LATSSQVAVRSSGAGSNRHHALAWSGIGEALSPFSGFLPYPVLAVCSILWIVWATNLCNFLDGIDGLAGGQAVIASLGFSCAAGWLGHPVAAGLLLLLAASTAGFRRYAFPKPRSSWGTSVRRQSGSS
jgi:Fuc2NAc and GlcNAc transferase